MSDINEQAGKIVDKVKSAVGGLVDQSGDAVAKVVDKVTDAVDDGTGGTASAVTAKVDEVLFGALGKAVDASRAALNVAASAKDAVRKPESS